MIRRFTLMVAVVVALSAAVLFSGDRWIPWWGEGAFGEASGLSSQAAPVTMFSAPSGHQLALRRTPPAAEAFAAAVIVHGLGLHGGWYRGLAERLSEAGVLVVTVDLPGHGLSTGRRGTMPAPSTLVGDLASVAAEVSAARPELPLLLIGHSFGAELVSRPALVRAVTEAGVPLGGVAALAPFFSGAGVEAGFDIERPLFSVSPRGLVSSAYPALRYNWPSSFEEPLLQSTFDRSLLHLWHSALPATERLKSLSLPVLLLAGQDDAVISADRVAALAAAVDSTSVTFGRVAGADHMSLPAHSSAALLAWARHAVGAETPELARP